MKPIVGLDFSSSALKSCHPPLPLYSQVSLNRWWEEEPQQGSSVSGLLAELQGCWLMLGSCMALLLCFFFLFLSCCFVFCTFRPFIFSVRYFARRLFNPFPSTHDLGAAQTSARHWNVYTDWLTEEFSVLCCFSFTLCNSLDVFFFFLRNFQGGFVPCLRLVMMMMWVSCHWIQCSSVWPWLRPNLSSSDPQKYTEKTQNLMLLNCLQLYVWSTSCVCLFRRWQHFVLYIFVGFFLVRWSTEDGGDVLCHYMSRDCRRLMPNWCCDLRFCWQDAEFRMEEDSSHYVCVSIFLQPDTKNLSGPFVQQVYSLVTVPPELLCLKRVCVRCTCRKTLKKKKNNHERLLKTEIFNSYVLRSFFSSFAVNHRRIRKAQIKPLFASKAQCVFHCCSELSAHIVDVYRLRHHLTQSKP